MGTGLELLPNMDVHGKWVWMNEVINWKDEMTIG